MEKQSTSKNNTKYYFTGDLEPNNVGKEGADSGADVFLINEKSKKVFLNFLKELQKSYKHVI